MAHYDDLTGSKWQNTWPVLSGERLADDLAVTAFAIEMRAKLAKSREKGRSGWQTCPVGDLWKMLQEHFEKGDPVDVANFAMMIWHNSRGAS